MLGPIVTMVETPVSGVTRNIKAKLGTKIFNEHCC